MTEQEFRQEYFGAPLHDPLDDYRFRRAVELWARYYVLTEEFDRQLPGAFFRDDWLPSAEFMPDSRRFARRCLQRLCEQIRGLGPPITGAREYVQRLSHDQRRKLLAFLERKT